MCSIPEVPRLGVELELWLPAYTIATACGIWAASATCTTAHGHDRSLTHWARPGTEPTPSWILVGFLTNWTTKGTPYPFLNQEGTSHAYVYTAVPFSNSNNPEDGITSMWNLVHFSNWISKQLKCWTVKSSKSLLWDTCAIFPRSYKQSHLPFLCVGRSADLYINT